MKKVRDHPYSVIQFDHVEKAHPRFFDVMIQVLDKGHHVDSSGMTTWFSEAILIFNSGVDASFRSPSDSRKPQSSSLDDVVNRSSVVEIPMRSTQWQDDDQNFKRLLQECLPLEFLNQIQERVLFHPFTRETARKLSNRNHSDVIE